MSGELATKYLGIELVSPVIVGACPLTLEPETVRQFVGAGVGAVVLPSMMQEQIVHRLMKPHDPLGAIEKSGYQPQQDKYNGGTEAYLKTIATLKKTCPVPVIASLSGSSTGPWLAYAMEIESAGADALEINLQQAIFDTRETSNDVEARLCQLVHDVQARLSIPVAAKISQRYTNVSSMARQLHEAGAAGLVVFTHVPAWDVSTDRMHWMIHWELSPVGSLGGILEGVVRASSADQGLSIAASGGVSTAEDAIKAMIAGADVVMVTSAVYREGPDAIRNIVDGIERHLGRTHYPTLKQFRAACPKEHFDEERLLRLEHVDPLTRGDTYFDPTPTVSPQTGDAFGHRN
ncbi:Dihydroorotate dehydrogenase B (NAD(+)), catalytic subunit [Rubripirellula tenax]|uniref:Dihydroorotate dehydrogenase B (NAD(+)), catalytic subunit n=1 Tax=Rubripirellula tenax TaxID=2528015 RepID=A0A5C6EQI7_9BACT|nr:dihydroorotate dehydrogenase-like protein [Rubripirellula tenax]TWU50560.1 Dihydroorotate dehydrogenase B (NAD(+)), catalytic subunit [Rubripirellula tenax]